VLAALGLVALMTTGCQNAAILNSLTRTSAVSAPPAKSDPGKSDVDWRREAESLGAKYRADPNDPDIALAYAQALRASGQRSQAVSVLEQASLRQPHNTVVLGAYGKALADVGNLEQALEVLNRAHTPDQPNWHILSAQGAVLDQLGRHQEAQGYYASALKIRPDDPSVLSNLGLSYALAKDLKNAEATLRRAAGLPRGRTRGCGRISRWWSGCRAASQRPRPSRAPTCRPSRPPPTSPICGKCWHNKTT
jgi:Flp pilus assembly protein TadD